MRRLILTIPAFIFLITLSFAGEAAPATFTNQDLNKYKDSTPTSSLENTGVNVGARTHDDDTDDDTAENEPVRHIIPYKVADGMEMSIIVPVTFNNYVTDNMLLDTGASGMHISLELANKLGILDNDEAGLIDVVSGVGGAVPVIVTIIDKIKIGDVEYEFIPTTISTTKFRNFKGLLGMDFMTNYSVHIDNIKHEVVFEELPDNSEMPAGRSETWWRVTYRNFKLMKAKWRDYRDKLYSQDRYSTSLRDLKKVADRQYDKADELLTRLDVYASIHSVPLEWR